MKIRKIILGAVAVVVGLPLALMVIGIVWISFLDRTNGSLVSSGETREYLLHVPDTYDSARPTPLVISMHGGAAWPAQQKNLSQWNRLADENGFIVVYPSGTPVVFGIVKIWQPTPEGVLKDVQFISALVDRLEAAYNIDSARIYADGMSMGGGMAFALSCTLSDRIAAIGLVAAAQALPFSWCTDTRPVPVMAFHGAADPIVPYDGGPLGDPFNPVKPVYPAVRDFVASWAARNHCAASPVKSAVAPDVTRLEYPDCAEDAAVVLYTVLGGGHTWPGGKPLPKWWVGPTSSSIDATSQMWAFFRAHRLTSR